MTSVAYQILVFAKRKWGWVGVDYKVRAPVLQGGVSILWWYMFVIVILHAKRVMAKRLQNSSHYIFSFDGWREAQIEWL